MPTYREYLDEMTASGAYCTDPIGKCLRERFAINGVPRKDIHLCIRDSDTYAAAKRGDDLSKRFSLQRSVKAWLKWTHNFSQHTPAMPECIWVDWSSGVFKQELTEHYGCLSDVNDCLWGRDDDGQWFKLTTPMSCQPSEPRNAMEDFETCIASYKDEPETTRKALIDARLGQGKFRESLLMVWNNKCSVTKCSTEQLLRASHIKPWRDSSNIERLDKFNGLLLIPNLDLAFDRGLISFSDTGRILISGRLKDRDQSLLGINPTLQLACVYPENRSYLQTHRKLHNFSE